MGQNSDGAACLSIITMQIFVSFDEFDIQNQIN